MPLPDYGTDIATFRESGFGDLDPNFTVISGLQVLAEAVARRITTPRGGLVGDPGYGIDVRNVLNETLSPARKSYWETALTNEVLKDERIADAELTLNQVSGREAFTLDGFIEAADGPTFELTLSIDKVSVQILKVEPS